MASLSTAEAPAAAAAAEAEADESSALDKEIAKSIEEGKGWKEGEREAYLKKVSEEDHPMFAENIEVGDCGAIRDHSVRAVRCLVACRWGWLRLFYS